MMLLFKGYYNISNYQETKNEIQNIYYWHEKPSPFLIIIKKNQIVLKLFHDTIRFLTGEIPRQQNPEACIVYLL